MSFADELREAEKRLKKQQKEEAERGKRRRVGGGGGGPRSGVARSTEWSWENEIVAFYLQKSASSKFLVENYATKRKMAPGTMKKRMEFYGTLMKNPSADASAQERLLMTRFAAMEIPEMQKIVIAILRGEYRFQDEAVTVRRSEEG